jgi:glutathione synthase
MKIGFLMDPLDQIDPSMDTTSHLIYECNQRGHESYFLEPHDLYIKSNRIRARMKTITTKKDLHLDRFWRRLIRLVQMENLVFEDISGLDALFMRKNPPVNFNTIAFLQFVKDDVFIINDIHGQMRASNKLYQLNFNGIIPETHVSKDPIRLRKIIEEFGGDMIMKPSIGFSGQGVIKLSMKDPENLNSLLHYYVDSTKSYEDRRPVVVQEYIEEVRDGDVRILLLNGEILGAMKRVPCNGEFRTNIHTGARAEYHRITESERKICETIKEKIVADGLYFVGIDIIGDKLIEINSISPGGIPNINRLNNVRLEERVIDFIEEEAVERGEQKEGEEDYEEQRLF